MKEHNKKTLIEALSTLPEYEPSDQLWEKIEEASAETDGAIFPHEALRQLPQYSPPDGLWEGILQKLEARPAVARILPLRWKQGLAVAASLAILVTVFLYLSQQQSTTPQSAIALNYSEETVDTLLLSRDWDDDEDAFQEFLSLCEGKKYICEQPEFQQLKDELEELTMAKEDLKSVLGDYGTDADLVLQIKEIELERTDLLKKIMVMLI